MKAPHKNTLAIALLTGLLISSAHATLFNVDFNHDGSGTAAVSGTMTGAAVIGTAGDTWNGITGGTYNTALALVDSTDTASSATVTVNSNNVNGSWDNNALAATDAVALMADYLNINANASGATATVSVNNLVLNSNYIIHLFGVGDAADQFTIFSVVGSDQGGTQSTLGGSASPLASPQHYVTFTGNTGATGEVEIEWTQGGTWTAFNGFQLQVASIPEPSAAALLAGMFGLTWVMLRRRA